MQRRECLGQRHGLKLKDRIRSFASPRVLS